MYLQIILTFSLDEEERMKNEGAHTYEINQGERPTGDSVNLSSALYHITMAKRLMIQKTCSDVESHDAANVVNVIMNAFSNLSFCFWIYFYNSSSIL